MGNPERLTIVHATSTFSCDHVFHLQLSVNAASAIAKHSDIIQCNFSTATSWEQYKIIKLQEIGEAVEKSYHSMAKSKSGLHFQGKLAWREYDWSSSMSWRSKAWWSSRDATQRFESSRNQWKLKLKLGTNCYEFVWLNCVKTHPRRMQRLSSPRLCSTERASWNHKSMSE